MECRICDGMRVCACGRDWREERRAQFAGMAMSALIREMQSPKEIARLSVGYADQLIAALDKGEAGDESV